MELGYEPFPDTSSTLAGLRKHFLGLVISATGTTEKLHRFPGTMPITLSRRHIQMVAHSDYVCLEKSDGMRYMLLAIKDFVVLIDRQMRFFLIKPNPAIMTQGFTGHQDNTCLDGELTYNIVTKQWDYLIYDAIAIDGDLSVAQRGFRERMQAAETFVAGPRLWAPFCSGLLRLRIKDYYEKRDLRKLFSRIRKDPKGHYIYMNIDRRDGVICNENDGLIFSPVGMPYQVRNCPALLKWKPPHLNSIDFTLQLEPSVDPKRNNQPSVRCFIAYKGERGICRLREVYFPSKVRQKFTANFDVYNGKVVELAYDRLAGEWKYIRKRDDKDGPNFSSTVIDTMETIAESMEREELVTYMEVNSKPIPSSENAIVKANARNEEVCTFREDYFGEDNDNYLAATPISVTAPPMFAGRPHPRSGRGPRRPPTEGHQDRMTNGEAHGNREQDGPPASPRGRAAFEYSDDV